MAGALEVSGLTVSYRRSDAPSAIAVWRAALSLERGQVLGLLGESGCGKSTLALAAMGYRPPGAEVIEGSSCLGDTDLLALRGARLRRL